MRQQFSSGNQSGTKTSSSSRQVQQASSFVQSSDVIGGVNSNDAIVELLLLINACKLASAESITVTSSRFFSQWYQIQKWINQYYLNGIQAISCLSRVNHGHLIKILFTIISDIKLYLFYFSLMFLYFYVSSFPIPQVVTPYFPYSKGDQKSSLRSPISSKLIANMLKRLPFQHRLGLRNCCVLHIHEFQSVLSSILCWAKQYKCDLMNVDQSQYRPT